MVFPPKKKRFLGKGVDGGAGAGGWSTLPAELLGEVSGRLTSDADVLHIHQVCAHWRASTAPLAAGRPWIVAGHVTSQVVSAIGEDYSFWLPHGGGGGGQRIPCFGDAPTGLPYCCGTPRGWLALADAPHAPTRLVLWDPVSKAEIVMPPLPRAGFTPQIFLSGDPLASASPEWMAIAGQPFSIAGKWQMLFFWRPGDAAWTPQREPPTDRIDSVAFHGRFLYFTVRRWFLYAYDLHHDAPWPPARVRSTFVYFDVDSACELSKQDRPLRAAHVVATADGVDLLLVVLYWECRRRSVQTVAKVFRMEWAVEAKEKRLELSPVTDLGEHALLLGRGDALALSAAEFPAIRRNCVYFVEHDKAPHRHWVIAMDLETNASEMIPHPQFQEEDGKCAADLSLLPYSWFCLKEPFFKHK